MPIQIRIGLVIVAAVSAVIVVLAAVIAVVTRFEVASVLGPDKIRTLPTLMHAVVPSLRRRSVKDLDVGAATLRTWVTKGRPNLRHFRFKSPSCVVAFALPAAGLAKDWEERWEQAQRFLAERDGPVAI